LIVDSRYKTSPEPKAIQKATQQSTGTSPNTIHFLRPNEEHASQSIKLLAKDWSKERQEEAFGLGLGVEINLKKPNVAQPSTTVEIL